MTDPRIWDLDFPFYRVTVRRYGRLPEPGEDGFGARLLYAYNDGLVSAGEYIARELVHKFLLTK
jgi:hypothetical protein